MSETLCTLRTRGGVGGESSIPQISSGTTRGTTNTSYTYNATTECFLTVLWTVSYAVYGSRKVTLNNTDILDDSTKGTFCDVVHLKSGDVCTITLESGTTPAYYGIALIS